MGQTFGSMRTSAWTLLAAVIAVCVAICAADLAATSDEVAFLQTQQEMGTVRGHCEICIAVMQAKERGEPHLCASFRHPTYYTTCVEVITSLLRADRALVYWIENGCIHNDPSQRPLCAVGLVTCMRSIPVSPSARPTTGTGHPKLCHFAAWHGEEGGNVKCPNPAVGKHLLCLR